MMDPVSLTPLGESMNQAVALKVLESGRNAFLTGPPGAGKSYLIRQFVTVARRDKKVAVTASTGIAGTHIGGMTLHSWAGLGVRDHYGSKEIADIADKAWVANRIRSADVLVIDEISMLRVETFEAANAVCKKVRRSHEPFGGLQVVLCGDFFQLPPVAQGRSADFIYGCQTWQESNLAVLYLSEQFRQSDDSLLDVLNAIRAGDVEPLHFERLEQRMQADLSVDVVPTRLHTHNVNVDRVNSEQLAKLSGPAQTYEAVADGPERLVSGLRNSCMAMERLQLKKGAAVMFVKNSLPDGYVNGTLGTVIDFHEGFPQVLTDRGDVLVVKPQSWVTEDASGRALASLTQTPLRLAWAISVHKSQGMSLTAAEMDLSRAFVEGLGYVALSRVTTMDGIRLLGLNRQALMVSERALCIDAELQQQSNDVLAGVYQEKKAAGSDSEAMSLF